MAKRVYASPSKVRFLEQYKSLYETVERNMSASHRETEDWIDWAAGILKDSSVDLGPHEARRRLCELMEEMLDFAVEGWSYVSPYFREKWRYEEQLSEFKDRLPKKDDNDR